MDDQKETKVVQLSEAKKKKEISKEAESRKRVIKALLDHADKLNW